MTDRPNVLVLFTDDQRFNTLAALGNEQIHTPNLDRLIARGTTFTHAHIMGGTCAAVCMPSRAMLHTGRTLFHLETGGATIPTKHALMGETFGAAGYQTFGTGKWHNGPEAYARSFTAGDEIFFGGMTDHWNVPACHFDPTGEYASFIPQCVDAWSSRKLRRYRADHVPAGRHSTDILAEATCRFLAERDRSRPFFSYVSFLAPHDPRTMPQKYLDMYDPEAIELPPNFMGGHPFDNGELYVRDEKLEAWPRTDTAIRQHIAEYYAMITHVDDRIGDIVAALEQAGDLDHTIIVFAGDNGLALGQHGLMGKQNLYDHSVRVPLVFAGPGVPQGEQRDSYCYLIDVFATLCDLVGLDTPDTVEGVSLKPAIEDGSVKVREVMLCAYLGLQRSARDQRYKLIEYVVDRRRTTQLFDMQDDPWERVNLADDPARAGDVERLRGELRRWRDELDDTADDFWGAMEA